MGNQARINQSLAEYMEAFLIRQYFLVFLLKRMFEKKEIISRV